MGPGEIIDVLIALLETTLRAAEIGSGGSAIVVDDAGRRAGVCGSSDEAVEDETRFINEVRGY
jgi:hypothetical protein